jgi:hypothetical protein
MAHPELVRPKRFAAARRARRWPVLTVSRRTPATHHRPRTNLQAHWPGSLQNPTSPTASVGLLRPITTKTYPIYEWLTGPQFIPKSHLSDERNGPATVPPREVLCAPDCRTLRLEHSIQTSGSGRPATGRCWACGWQACSGQRSNYVLLISPADSFRFGSDSSPG